jgi:hypothetical protein
LDQYENIITAFLNTLTYHICLLLVHPEIGTLESAATELAAAFARSVPHPEAMAFRDDMGFFQAVRAALAKRAPGEATSD